MVEMRIKVVGDDDERPGNMEPSRLPAETYVICDEGHDYHSRETIT